MGIGQATNGDTVLVAPGVYPETLDFQGKAITVGGRYLTTGNPACIDSTVVDGGEAYGPLATFASGEDSLSVLAGLTLRNGSALRGAGALCALSSPRIVSCTFRSNEAQSDGGGIYADEGSPIVEFCVFDGNRAANHSGGGFAVRHGSPRVSGCVFIGNLAHDEGGAIFSEDSSAHILDNVIDGNTSSVTYAGGVMSRNCTSVIAGNAFTNNHTYGHGGGLFY
jgi:predicted outer membrane repeat protein